MLLLPGKHRRIDISCPGQHAALAKRAERIGHAGPVKWSEWKPELTDHTVNSRRWLLGCPACDWLPSPGSYPTAPPAEAGALRSGAGTGLATKAGFQAGCFIYDRPNL